MYKSAIRLLSVVEVIVDGVPGCDVSDELCEARNNRYPDRTDLAAIYSCGKSEVEAVLNAIAGMAMMNDVAEVETRTAPGLYNAIAKEAKKYSHEIKPVEEESDDIFALVFFKYEDVEA